MQFPDKKYPVGLLMDYKNDNSWRSTSAEMKGKIIS